MTMENKPTQTDVIINTAYMLVLTLELMVRDTERRLMAKKERLHKEKKLNLARFCESAKRALFYAEQLTEDIYTMDSKHNYSNIQTWQDESNELARLILLYSDRATDIDNVNKVFRLLCELPGENIVNDEMLDYYRLKQL